MNTLNDLCCPLAVFRYLIYFYGFQIEESPRKKHTNPPSNGGVNPHFEAPHHLMHALTSQVSGESHSEPTFCRVPHSFATRPPALTIVTPLA